MSKININFNPLNKIPNLNNINIKNIKDFLFKQPSNPMYPRPILIIVLVLLLIMLPFTLNKNKDNYDVKIANNINTSSKYKNNSNENKYNTNNEQITNTQNKDIDIPKDLFDLNKEEIIEKIKLENKKEIKKQIELYNIQRMDPMRPIVGSNNGKYNKNYLDNRSSDLRNETLGYFGGIGCENIVLNNIYKINGELNVSFYSAGTYIKNLKVGDYLYGIYYIKDINEKEKTVTLDYTGNFCTLKSQQIIKE